MAKKSKAKNTEDLIDQLELARRGNNVNWMDLARIAFRHAPDEAAACFKKINAADAEISAIARRLAE